MFQDMVTALLKYLPIIGLVAAKIVLLLAAYLVVRTLLRRLAGKLFRPAIERVSERTHARIARLKSLETVFNSSLNFVLGFIVLIMVLQLVGINIVPLITTAGVAGLAVGFGAQKLVRDVISGFFIIAEDQYGVGDYVTIGAISGTVESLGIRTTSIRDLQGKITIISNGIIDQIGNFSRGAFILTQDYVISADVSETSVRDALVAGAEKLKKNLGADIQGSKICPGYINVSAASKTYRVEVFATPEQEVNVKSQLNLLVDAELKSRDIKLL